MNSHFQLTCVVFFVLLCGACSPSSEHTQVPCDSTNNATPLCGFSNPEDLAVIPHSTLLLVSEMGPFMTNAPGNLVLLDRLSERKVPMDITWQAEGASWGDPSCEVPDMAAFSPHGIDVVEREDKRIQVLVVNHGKRESVEFFELIKGQANEQSALIWRGCAIPPEDPFLNDVSALNHGGFAVTHMWDKQTPYWLLVSKYLLGMDTGWVWLWQQDTGFSKLGESRGTAPNGIAVDQQNNYVFVNYYGEDITVKINLAEQARKGVLKVRQPDNVTIDNSDNLWIASHLNNPVTEDCNDVMEGPCMLPFKIVKADADSMLPLAEIQQGDMPMGFATVALRVEEQLYLGSAFGDRLIKLPLSAN